MLGLRLIHHAGVEEFGPTLFFSRLIKAKTTNQGEEKGNFKTINSHTARSCATLGNAPGVLRHSTEVVGTL